MYFISFNLCLRACHLKASNARHGVLDFKRLHILGEQKKVLGTLFR